jgi:eukaryotic-like serine/threonine-protein kinase
VSEILANEAVGSRFEVLAPLGRGGFGSVYEARDRETGQRVALKELGRPSGDNLARFKQEFRALAGLEHPNLVGLRELFEQNGRWFIVMELIAGCDFIAHVRSARGADNSNEPEFDEGKLRTALRGIAQGLIALHEFGVLHRDLKPSNVCVTPEGLAVLLDFGLVTSVDPARQSTHGIGIGTVAYMAPEQGMGGKLGPAADFYALGVCLFEALTDRLPFEGRTGLQMLLDKQQRVAPRASLFARNVPADLDQLCARLLERNPEARPRGPDLLAALGIQSSERPGEPISRSIHVSGAPQPAFAGREAEIDNMERALLRTHEGEFRLLLVEGESGVGKSELVGEFLRNAKLRHLSLVTLSGRCYENERVPYKAFDGCVDELAKLLRKLPDEECRALLPERAALLGQLFPVLSHVPAIAKARRDQLSADPTARRLEAFAALAELLGKLAVDRPVVLFIDDLQWADAESFRLLKALVEHRERPPLLVVATIRPRDELEPEILELVEKARAWKCTDVQLLFGLPRGQAEALAASLLGDDAEPAWIRAIAEESRGHPLLLSELVRFAKSRELASSGRISLDDALKARIEPLQRRSRELLELVALAGRPCSSQIFAHALGIGDVDELAKPLLRAKLLRKRKGHELGCFHDRIRQLTVSLIARSRLPQLHQRLAEALARDERVDASEQARHWDLAGHVEQAIAAHERAARSALDALAFVRAAQLSGRALELLQQESDPRRGRLLVQRAHALACAGLSGEAAALYGRAADLAHGDERIRLQSSAANHLMLSAQVEPGLLAAQRVLAELGVSLPLGARAALLRFAWERLCYALFDRVLRRKTRSEARDRLALEVISMLNRSLAMLHVPAYLALSAQHLRLAAALSDPAQLVQSYVIQGWLRTMRGSLTSGLALLDKSRQLCAQLGQPALSAWQALSEGTARMFGWDAWGCEECLTRAQALLQTHCPDQPRELTTAQFSLGLTWYLLGRHARLARETEGWLAEAHERHDRFGAAMLIGGGAGFARHLMQDSPEAALAELEEAMAHVPADSVSMVSVGYLFGVQTALVYQGGRAALAWLEARRAEHERCFVLKAGFGKDVLGTLRVLGLLRAAEHMSAPERRACFQKVRRLAEQLGRRRANTMHYFSLLVLAQLAAIEGRTELALHELRQARARLPDNSWFALQSGLYLEGLLTGAAGQEKCETALRTLRDEGWQNPERALTIYAPLLPLLARRTSRSPEPKRLLVERYEVLGALGSGGFGNVMEGRDVATGRRVALKELVGKQARALERFKREFRALQNVHHPNLVRLDALFEHEGAWYIAMELVEGTDLCEYVRPGGVLDFARLRAAFSGLAQALGALHELGFVHRDVTPANVRVTSTGRAVLLDFGLLAQSGDETEATVVGTPAYAAPEQLAGSAPAALADVYALGVCLYEGLTGALPHAGETPPALLRAKRGGAPRTASPASPELALCLRMLRADADQRPSLAEVVALLSPLSRARSTSTGAMRAALRDSEGPGGFSGRQLELSQLRSALARARSSGACLAIVQGESGLGKSALIAEFTRRVLASEPDVLLLSSRCYENEQVALKAFDGAVDQLAHTLARLSPTECSELLPKRTALLAQLFPVLSGVPAIASAGKKGLPADPAARRLAAFECFYELLERLSTRYCMVFTIDDLQWADAESYQLLHGLLERGSALPSLVIGTSRADVELEDEAASQIAALCALPDVEVIALSGLSEDDAAVFAAQLMGDTLAPAFVSQLVLESKGHPLFLRELVTRAKSGNLSLGAPSLDDALRARMDALDPQGRTLLALVALAGKPCRAHVFAAAMGRSELPPEAVAQLLGQSLLRQGARDELACYHDRIRQAALQLSSATRQRELAKQLALALDSEPGADTAERARLWEEAGDWQRAVEVYEQAGEQALQGLTFAQAERHFARAFALLGERKEEPFGRICVQRAHALVRMGQSADAARFFQLAADVAQGEQQIRLRVWVAQHLIQGAQVEAGLLAASAVLGELGLSFAKSERAALARISWERARITLRGTKLRQRRRPIGSAERLVLDALNDLNAPVAAVSSLPGTTLATQYLRLALDSGDPRHGACALAIEALWRTIAVPARDHSALFDQAQELAERVGDPAVAADVGIRRGLACVARGELGRAPNYLELAHELLQTECPGQPWLLTRVRMYLGLVWVRSGKFHKLTQHAAPWLAEARAKHDRYAVAALSGFGGASYRFLLKDDPAAMLAELDAAMAPWPEEPFSDNHFGACNARTSALLAQGGGEALAWLAANRLRFERSLLMRAPTPRGSLIALRAFACLSAIPSAQHAPQHPLFAEAAACARSLARTRTAIAPGLVRLLRASLSALAGREAEAVAHAQAVQSRLPELAFARGAHYLEGLVTGGESGRAKCEATVAWLRAEGSVNPERHLRELVPGLDLLVSRRRA